jgi:sec-independent protein translocase protein TatA
MGGLSLPHLIVVALLVLVLFGRGRISEMMGDFGKGIKSFKRGIDEEMDGPAEAPPPRLGHEHTPAPAHSVATPAPSTTAPATTPTSQPLVGAGERGDTP